MFFYFPLILTFSLHPTSLLELRGASEGEGIHMVFPPLPLGEDLPPSPSPLAGEGWGEGNCCLSRHSGIPISASRKIDPSFSLPFAV